VERTKQSHKIFKSMRLPRSPAMAGSLAMTEEGPDKASRERGNGVKGEVDRMTKSRAKVIVKGIVQGVNFRYYTQRQAIRGNITGWVRNLPDGSVAAVFEGDEQDVEAMVQWCRHGPPSAQVTELIVQPEEFRGEFSSFSLKY
jgi:acylphosphatase